MINNTTNHLLECNAGFAMCFAAPTSKPTTEKQACFELVVFKILGPHNTKSYKVFALETA